MDDFRKPNLLIESSCTLSIYGHRIVNSILHKFNPNDPEINIFKIDFKDVIGDHASGSQYSKAHEVLNNLTSQFYSHYESFNTYLKIFPFEFCNIIKGHPRIEITITQQFINILKTMSSGNYTVLNLISIYKMTSVYSIRMYELLQQYMNTEDKTRLFELNKLKFYLNVPQNKYQNYYDFKRFIIKTADFNFQKHTNIKFQFFEIKNGHKVIKLKFVISENVQNFKELTTAEIVAKFLRDNYGIKKSEEYLKNYKIEYLQQCIEYAKKYSTKNFKKYLELVIRDNPMKYGVISDEKEIKPEVKQEIVNNSQDAQIDENIENFKKLSQLQQNKLFETCSIKNCFFNSLPIEIKMNIAYELYLNES